MSKILSQRAQHYLSTLERITPVSPERLRRLMVKQGIEPTETWLTFQENYAGYIESIGNDGAVWGIIHEAKRFFEYPEPLQVEHDYYEHEQARVVTCADVHASYDYLLTETGKFLGRPSERFEIYVEQMAFWHEFLQQHPRAKAKYLYSDTSLNSHLETDAEKIPEASDKYHTYVVSDQLLGIKEEQSGRWIRVLNADPPAEMTTPPEATRFGKLLRNIKSRIGNSAD